MKRDISIGLLSQTAFLIAIFCFMTVSTFGHQTDAHKSDVVSGNVIENTDSFIIAAGGSLSQGMTKLEAYEVKGMPDKTNRLPGEDGKEMWVYKCENEDGYNEDCLYLYFDGDKLVKIERL